MYRKLPLTPSASGWLLSFPAGLWGDFAIWRVCVGGAEAVAVPCPEGAWLGSHSLPVSGSDSQSTDTHPAETPRALRWALGKPK